MAESESKQGSHFDKGNTIFKDVMRKNGMSWTPDKYARMGIYVYLYNRIKGRPTEFGLSDEDVSFRLRDFIYNNYDHLVTRFRLDQVEEIDFKNPDVKKQFLAEMDEYNQHALEIDSNMPSTLKINEFLEAVAHSRSANFSMLHASTKEKPGVEFFEDGDPGKKYKNGYLIKEREKVLKEIKNQTRRIRRETGWATLKGVGALGSAALTVVSGLALLSPASLALGPAFAASFLTRAIVGVVGIGFGITGLRSFGTSFATACGKIFGMRRKRRDMIYEDGEQGKRGLKAVEHALELHRQLKRIYIDFHKMGKDGKLPTEDEFMKYVKKHFPLAYKDPRSSLGQLYKEAGYFTSAKKGGVMRGVMEFIARNEVSVTRNDQIAIERDDIYNEVFNGGTGVGKDGKIASMEKFRETLNNFVADKEVYKTMHRDYRSHEINATNALVEVYKNEIFETPFSQSKVRLTKETLKDKNIADFLERNPKGSQTLMVSNAIQFMESEAQLDKNQGFQLDDSFNASIKAQLTRQADDMAEACTKLGVDTSSPEYADVTSIASSIQGLTVRSGASKILDDINNSSMSAGAKNYLKKMLEHRKKESRVSSDELKSALGVTGGAIPAGSHRDIIYSVINSLQMVEGSDQRVSFVGTHNGTTYDIDSIRTLISQKAYISSVDGSIIEESVYRTLDPATKAEFEYRTILEPDQISNITRLLEEQRDSIEIRHRNEIRESAYGVIKDGEVGIKLDEVMTKIKEFQFEDISEKDKLANFQQYWQTQIRKANPKELSEYLTMRVKQRLEESVMEKLNDPNRYIGEGGLDMLAKDLNTITGSIYLDQSQKDRIIAKIEEKHLKAAFGKEFELMKRNILKDFSLGKNEYRDKLIRFIKLPYSAQGFSNLLGENGRSSPIIDELKAQIGEFQTAVQLSEYLTVVAPGTQRTVDPDSGDTYAILNVLLKEGKIGDKDKLINEITSLFQNVQEIEMKGLTQDGVGRDPSTGKKSRTIVDMLSDKMTATLSSTELKPDEQLAILLLIKKNALSFVKAHLKKFIIDPHRGTEDEYMKSAEGSENIRKIKEVWEKLCADIDTNINMLKNSPDCYKMCNGLRFSSASNTLNEAVSTGKMVSYVNSATSEIGAATLGG